MADEANGPYRVHASQVMLDRLRELGRRAAARGERDAFKAALQFATNRLATDPLNWGEPIYHLPGLNTLVFHGAVAMLHLYYVVIAASRTVTIGRAHLFADDQPGGNGVTRHRFRG